MTNEEKRKVVAQLRAAADTLMAGANKADVAQSITDVQDALEDLTEAATKGNYGKAIPLAKDLMEKLIRARDLAK